MVDDGIFAEQGTDDYLQKVTEFAVDCQFAAFGMPSAERPNLISFSKLSVRETGGWSTMHKVLGILMNTASCAWWTQS